MAERPVGIEFFEVSWNCVPVSWPSNWPCRLTKCTFPHWDNVVPSSNPPRDVRCTRSLANARFEWRWSHVVSSFIDKAYIIKLSQLRVFPGLSNGESALVFYLMFWVFVYIMTRSLGRHKHIDSCLCNNSFSARGGRQKFHPVGLKQKKCSIACLTFGDRNSKSCKKPFESHNCGPIFLIVAMEDVVPSKCFCFLLVWSCFSWFGL